MVEKSWYRKIFDDVLEKVISILGAIRNNRNKVIFSDDKCNPCYILELAKKTFMKLSTIRYALTLPSLQELQVLTMWMQVKDLFIRIGSSSPRLGQIQYKRSKNRATKIIVIKYVCRGKDGSIINKDERNIGDIPILVVETLDIWNTLKQAIQKNYWKVITESNSLIAIQATNGNSIPPIQICNLVEDKYISVENLIISVLYAVGDLQIKS